MKARYSYFLVALTMVSALIGGAIGAQTVAVADGQGQTALPQNATRFENGPASFSPLVKAVKPAVVNISISGHVQTQQFQGPPGFPEGSPFEQFFRDYFGGRGPDGSPGPFSGPRVWSSPSPEFKAVGSGFIISADGLVVTNNHVIDHADEIEVVLQDGTRYSATIQGRDAKTDLALLKLDTDDELPNVELGSSENAEVGDWVV
ncbi:MAG: trypsin-like peptidase domain-containing protein, partial [Gammaproteobacteria bacterium]